MRWLDRTLRDIRFGIRTLAKSPGFTSVALLSLSLGIMASTAIYSVLHAVVLDPFPYKDVDSLMSVRVWSPDQRGYRTGYSTDQFLEIAERSTIFDGVIASTISDVLWTGKGDPQRLRGNHGTPNTFQVMGVPALVGRTYTPSDGRHDAAPVVVLGYRFWQRQFGGDPSVVGRELSLNGKVRTVVGVMPERFMWRGADVYLPIVFTRGTVAEGVRGVHLLGRLKPGVTEAQAEADLRPIVADLKQREPSQFPDNWRVGLLSFKETFPSSIRDDLWILFGAVGLLLLIACANVSNLLLARAGARQREMAVRAALGAHRLRLVRQLLTESLVLAVAAAVLGTALAFGALRLILAIVPPNTIPDESKIVINIPVLLFTLVVSAATAVIFGLAPAVHACRRDVVRALHATSRGLGGGAGQTLLRSGLVVAEVALSLMLLVGASLMIRALVAVGRADTGFPADRILAMRVPLPEARYPDLGKRTAFFQELLSRVSALPGVVAVGVNSWLHPLGNFAAAVEVPGGGAPDNAPPVLIHQVNGGYLNAFGIALVAGRPFDEADIRFARHVALVNETFARTRLANRALERTVRIPRLTQPPASLADDRFQIVGVVTDTLNRGLTEAIGPEIYLPFTLVGRSDRLFVRTAGDPAAVTRTVVNQVYEIDRNQPVTDVRTVETILQEGAFAGPRFNLTLFAVFAALGLTLAVIGVYGVMSHAVARQAHEIGVRIALGAEPGVIARMVVAHGSRLLVMGIAIGLVASFAATRWLGGRFIDASAFDPVSFVAVSALLLAAGLQACIWPARRASRIDPLLALRQE
jgi:putative ABC transport system permease protein